MDIEDTKVKKSLTELNYIINNMDEFFQEKIPAELRESIKENMDEEYILDIDIEKDYTQQEFLPETRALLSLIISEYIGDEDCQKKWKEFDGEYIKHLQKNANIENDIWKRNSEDFFKNRQREFEKDRSDSSNKEEKIENKEDQLVKYKELFIKTILKKIKSIFKGK